jgi:hypothetical protein
MVDLFELFEFEGPERRQKRPGGRGGIRGLFDRLRGNDGHDYRDDDDDRRYRSSREYDARYDDDDDDRNEDRRRGRYDDDYEYDRATTEEVARVRLLRLGPLSPGSAASGASGVMEHRPGPFTVAPAPPISTR